MLSRKWLLTAGALAALLVGSVVVVAQVTYPKVLQVNPADLFADLVNGTPSPGNQFATGSQISGISGYKNGGAALTAWTYTFTSGQQYFFINPAGTLGTGTLTTEVSPGDGQRECFFSTQTQTAITWTASTGQTLDTTVPSAGVANTLQCILYSAATQKWYRVM